MEEKEMEKTNEYSNELKEKWGNTTQYKEYEEKSKNRTKQDFVACAKKYQVLRKWLSLCQSWKIYLLCRCNRKYNFKKRILEKYKSLKHCMIFYKCTHKANIKILHDFR